MKQRFVLISFVLLSNYISLLPENINDQVNYIAPTDDSAQLEPITIVGNICDLLQAGHSVDDVVEMISSDKAPSQGIKKLVMIVKAVLNKQNFKNNTKDITFENKQDEEFSAQKNFYINVKRAAIILGVIIVCYVLIKYHSIFTDWFKKLFGFRETEVNEEKVPDRTQMTETKDLQKPKPQELPAEKEALADKVQELAKKELNQSDSTSGGSQGEVSDPIFIHKVKYKDITQEQRRESKERLKEVLRPFQKEYDAYVANFPKEKLTPLLEKRKDKHDKV